MHNGRVPSTPRRAKRALVVPAAALALTLSACGGSGEAPSADESATGGVTTEPGESTEPTEPTEPTAPTESPTADVSVPDGVAVTAQGSDLSFGDSATVVFEPDQKRETVLQLTVTKARKGRLDDFQGFILDNDYKKNANYFYVDVTVENVGEGNVSRAPVPLWGVNQDNTLLPAVNFTTTFKPCASKPLPKSFGPGDTLRTCLVYLSPDKGSLESVSFRPDQAFDPIVWTGDVKPPKDKGDKRRSKRNRG
jgi:hypothetical protein